MFLRSSDSAHCLISDQTSEVAGDDPSILMCTDEVTPCDETAIDEGVAILDITLEDGPVMISYKDTETSTPLTTWTDVVSLTKASALSLETKKEEFSQAKNDP